MHEDTTKCARKFEGGVLPLVSPVSWLLSECVGDGGLRGML